MDYLAFLSEVSLTTIIKSNFKFKTLTRILKDKYEYNELTYKFKFLEDKFNSSINSIINSNIDSKDLEYPLEWINKLLEQMSKFYDRFYREIIDTSFIKIDDRKGQPLELVLMFNKVQSMQEKLLELQFISFIKINI